MTAREKTKLVSDLKLRGSPLLNRGHRLRSSCKECFLSKWKSKHEGETILKLHQEWQYWKTSCSAVSEGKKPDSWVVQLSEHLRLSELFSVVIYSQLTSISELYHFSSSSMMRVLMPCSHPGNVFFTALKSPKAMRPPFSPCTRCLLLY